MTLGGTHEENIQIFWGRDGIFLAMSANSQENESINLKVHAFNFHSSKLKKNESEMETLKLSKGTEQTPTHSFQKRGLIYSGLQTCEDSCHHRGWVFLS